jgi:hypothetical protein
VDDIVPDSSSPLLISFDLDVSGGSLTAYFNEPVNAATLTPSQVCISPMLMFYFNPLLRVTPF